jgi:hypothetical protein
MVVINSDVLSFLEFRVRSLYQYEGQREEDLSAFILFYVLHVDVVLRVCKISLKT